MIAQLRFQLLDALIRALVHGGRGNGGSGPTGLKNYEMRGVAPPLGQDRVAALDAVSPLGLFIAQLAAADLAHHG